MQLSSKIFFEEIKEQVCNGQLVRIKAKGNSMLPFIRNEKDELILKAIDGPIVKGMLLLVRLHEGNYIIHRVEKVDTHKIVLRGDGNVIAREVCTKENVIAKVAAVVHKGRTIKEESFVWNIYRYAWPKNYMARKILLALYRKWRSSLFLYK